MPFYKTFFLILLFSILHINVSIAQSCTVLTWNTGASIPDANVTGVSETVNYLGTSAVTDVNVTLNIIHTYVSDLRIRLTSPQGTTINLSNRHGGSGNNYVNTIFDDAATIGIVGGSAPFTGSFEPDDVLSIFNGENPNGNWTLRVSDHAGIDIGTLVNFSIEICTNVNIPPVLTATGNQSFCAQGTIPVVETISITDADDTTATAVAVQITSGYINGEDLLTLTGSHPSITSSWDVTEGKLTLEGPATLTAFEAAISAVVYSSSGTNPIGTRDFSITMGGPNYLPTTGHYYEFVPSLGIRWDDANVAASARTYYGLQGYLATLTSQAESDFSGEQANGTGWIGASDAAVEGEWRWVTGPESGTVFWNGLAGGSTPNYAFWNSGEPNNSGNEDYAHITHPNVNPNGSWNDLSITGSTNPSSNYHPQGYVVEYGGMSGDPILNTSATTQITISNYDFYECALDVTSLINSCSADAAFTTIGGTADKNAGSNWNNTGPKFNKWFKFIAPASGMINITVDIQGTKGNQRYTQLAIWENDGTTEISSKRYQTTLEDVAIGTVGLTVGDTYYISVDSFNTSTDGTFTLCLQDIVDYDFYEGAIDVTSIINSCSSDAVYTTIGGTPDKNAGSNWNNTGPKFNRWFKFTAPASGMINVTVDIQGIKGSQRYTQLALWEADGITEINSERYQSNLEDVALGSVSLTPGATYYISVDSFNTSTDGSFTLCLDDTVDYDFYEGAIDITGIMNSCSSDAIYTTIGGTADKNAGSNWNNSGPKFNRWFKFIAPFTGMIDVTVDINSTKGNQRYTQLALWEADGTTEIKSERYQTTLEDVSLGAIGLTVGATYYISVDSFNNSTDGSFTMCLDDRVDYDFYEGAIDVTSIINSCSADAIYTTIGATPDRNAGSAWNNSGPKFNRWFTFIAPATGMMNITVDINGIKGNQRYTQLALWEADGVTEIKSERYQTTTEDVILGVTSLTPGATYYISVDSFNTSTDGTFTLCLDDIVDYDFYEGAIDITSIMNSCSADALYSTIGATPDKNAGSNWNNSGPKFNRWFKFTAPFTGMIDVTVDINSTKGNQRYTQLALWEADGITEVKSERYQTTLEDVSLGAIGLTVGATYFISVDSFNTSTDGSFTLCLDDRVDYDFYEGAIDVTGIINSCSADAIYTTIGGTPDRNAGANWDNSGPKFNRWFTFIAPVTGMINITVDRGGTKGNQRYTQLALWEADGVTEIKSERYQTTTEDVILGVTSLTPGATYYISVDSFNTSTDGSFTLCLEDTVDYDFYEGAIDVTSLVNSCSANAIYTTIGATPDKNAGTNWNNSGPKFNRWFSFIASAGLINITVDRGGAKGSQRYTQLAVWEADGTTELFSKRYVSTGDDVTINASGLTIGNTYYISVDTFSNGTDGTFTLCLDTNDSELSLSLTSDKINACIGEAVVFTLTLTNNGPDAIIAASPALVSLLLPASFSYVSDVGYGTYNAVTGIWEVPDIAVIGVNNTRTIAITATAVSAGAIVNNASISYNPNIDNNGANDAASTTITIQTPATIVTQPVNVTTIVSTNANFTVIANDTDTYQWQMSTDGGVSYTNINDGSEYSGTQTNNLILITPGIDKNGYRYRVQVSNSVSTFCPVLISNQAILTTKVRTVITNRRVTFRVKKS